MLTFVFLKGCICCFIYIYIDYLGKDRQETDKPLGRGTLGKLSDKET